MELVALRVWAAAPLLLGVAALRGGLRLPSGFHRRRFVVAGVALVVHWLCFFQAVKSTRVLVALVVIYAASPVMALIAARFLGEPLSLRALAALLVGLGGAALAVNTGEGATAEGVLWALAGAVTLGISLLTLKPVAAELTGVVVAGWQLAVAAVITTPWMWSGVRLVDGDWWKVLALGLFLTGLSGLIFWWAVGRLPVAVVGTLLYLEPVSAVTAAAIALSEDPGVRGWVGVAVVVLAGAAATRVAAPTPRMVQATGAVHRKPA